MRGGGSRELRGTQTEQHTFNAAAAAAGREQTEAIFSAGRAPAGLLGGNRRRPETPDRGGPGTPPRRPPSPLPPPPSPATAAARLNAPPAPAPLRRRRPARRRPPMTTTTSHRTRPAAPGRRWSPCPCRSPTGRRRRRRRRRPAGSRRARWTRSTPTGPSGDAFRVRSGPARAVAARAGSGLACFVK